MNFEKLSGIGKVLVSKKDTVEVNFTDISLRKTAGRWVLTQGEILHRFKPGELDSLNIKSREADNEDAVFYPEWLRLDDNELALKGVMKWPLPHLISAGTRTHVVSASEYINFDKFLLNGKLQLAAGNRFELLEPYGLELDFNETYSDFLVSYAGFVPRLFGKVLLPATAPVAESEERLSFSFRGQSQLLYWKNLPIDASGYLDVQPNARLWLKPLTVTLDLSTEFSPGIYEVDPGYKGIYFHDFEWKMPRRADKRGQWSLLNDFSEAITSTDPARFAAWDAGGLQLNLDYKFSKEHSGLVNLFPAKLAALRIEVEEGTLTQGSLTGSIFVPFVSEDHNYPFTIAMSTRGFERGYLEEIENSNFTMNPGNAGQEVKFHINSAVFAENERIDLNIDVEWPALNVKVNGLDGFRLWGDYQAGFGQKGGAAILPQRAQGNVNGYAIEIERVGAGASAGMYGFGMSGSMVMAEDVTGETGPPIINMYSMQPSRLLDGTHRWVEYEDETRYKQPDEPLTEEEIDQMAENMLTQALSHNEELAGEVADYAAELAGERDGKAEDELKEIMEQLKARDTPPATETTEAHKVTLEEALYYLELMEQLLPEKERGRTQKFRKKISKISPEQIEEIAKIVSDIKGYVAEIAAKKAIELLQPMRDKLKKQATGATDKITKQVNDKTGKVNEFVTANIGATMRRLGTGVASKVKSDDPEIKATIEKVAKETGDILSAEITASITASVNKNINAPIVELIHIKILARTDSFVIKKITGLGPALLDPEQRKELLKPENFFGDAESLFKQIAADVTEMVDVNTLLATVDNTGKDALNGIDWGSITLKISEKVATGVLTHTVKSKLVKSITDKYEESGNGVAGAVAANVMANVDFNFDNLGDKLKSGKIDEIVVFDPTNISVSTSVADFKGQVKFTHDDPLWGDSWQASLYAKIKITPKFSVSAHYINGTVNSGFKYWFLELGIRGLNVPITPTPLTLDGASGRVFHHMTREAPGRYVPHASTRFGAGLHMYMFDTPSRGTTIQFDLGAEVEVYDNGFKIGLMGNAGIAYSNRGPIIEGSGYMSFSSVEKRFLAEFKVWTNTDPLLCAKAGMGADIGGGNWRIWMGRKEEPMSISLLCSDVLKAESWLDIANTGLSIGFRIQQKIDISSPWVNLGVGKFKGYARTGFLLGAEAEILFKPKFTIKEAMVVAALYAEVGVDYKIRYPCGGGCSLSKGCWIDFCDRTDTFVIAGVSLGGMLRYTSDPRPHIQGRVHGSITVLNIGAAIDMDADMDL